MVHTVGAKAGRNPHAVPSVLVANLETRGADPKLPASRPDPTIRSSPLRSRDATRRDDKSSRPNSSSRTLEIGRKHQRRTSRRGRDPDARFSGEASRARDSAGRGVDLGTGGVGFGRVIHAKSVERDGPVPVKAEASGFAGPSATSDSLATRGDRQRVAAASASHAGGGLVPTGIRPAWMSRSCTASWWQRLFSTLLA